MSIEPSFAQLTPWPDNMTDEEAALRLQSIMIAACEGNQDLSRGRDYSQVRRALLKRPDLYDVTPSFVRANRDLTSFWSYIKGYAAQWEPRRKHVYESFQPLLDRVEGLTKPPIASRQWTGKRRTPEQQARVVLALGYDALAGVEAMLSEFEKAHHNGGPVEPVEEQAITALKALKEEIETLIVLAEQGQPLEEALSAMKAASQNAFGWTNSPVGFALASLPLTGFCTALGVGVMHLVNAIAPGNPAAGVAFGGAAMTVHAASAAIAAQRKRGKRI